MGHYFLGTQSQVQTINEGEVIDKKEDDKLKNRLTDNQNIK